MKILIVDDSITSRRILINHLLKMGHSKTDFTEAENAIDAWELIKNCQFDIILTDRNMPRMCGLTLVSKIRQLENYNLVPIVMITSMNEKGDIIKALRNGVNGYIIKPFNEIVITKKLKEIFEQRILLKELE